MIRKFETKWLFHSHPMLFAGLVEFYHMKMVLSVLDRSGNHTIPLRYKVNPTNVPSAYDVECASFQLGIKPK